MDPDPPLCGDPTCLGSGCRQSGIDAWDEQMRENARQVVNAFLMRPFVAQELQVQLLKRGSRRWLPPR